MQSSFNYFANDTIVAISSALGGAIGLVRMSGPETGIILEKIVKKSLNELEPKRVYHGFLVGQDQEPIDAAVYCYYKNPQSFTGEDSAEFYIHGSYLVASRLVEEVIRQGGRQALPGEFSFRAVRNGKMTLSQAESIPELIEASNESAAALALEKLSGAQNRWIDEVSTRLRKTAMLSEVGIDFSDQDVEELELGRLKKQIPPVIEHLQSMAQSFDRGKRIQEGVPVAIIGLPNAGKSSFFNLLLGEDRSIVSDIPGTTRDVVREKITLKGKQQAVTFRLSDTAGIRKSTDTVESQGIERSRKAVQESDLVLMVIDASNPDWPTVIGLWSSLSIKNQKVMVIFNKADLLKSSAEKTALQEKAKSIPYRELAWLSSKTGEGIQETAVKFASLGESDVGRKKGELILTRLDHVKAIEAAIQDLERSLNAPEYDLFAADVRQALAKLSGIIGVTTSDDILGSIFSNFCIGK